jgi:hypothetical protein
LVEVETSYSGVMSSEADRNVLLNKRLVGEHHRSQGFLGGRGRMSRVAGLYDLSVESVMLVRSVLDSTGGAVGLHQAVLTLNNISVSLLGLLFDVSCVLVIHSVLEFVFWMCL